MFIPSPKPIFGDLGQIRMIQVENARALAKEIAQKIKDGWVSDKFDIESDDCECGNCDGEGTVECPECQGKGELVGVDIKCTNCGRFVMDGNDERSALEDMICSTQGLCPGCKTNLLN